MRTMRPKKTQKGEAQEMTPEFNARIMQDFLNKKGRGAIPSVLVRNVKAEVEDGSGILHVVKRSGGPKVVEVDSRKLGFEDSDVFEDPHNFDTDSLSVTKYNDKLKHVKQLPEISKEDHQEEVAKKNAYKLFKADSDEDNVDDPMADLLEEGFDY